ncbi:MAG: AtpZ/AtpI family protein [Gemmatimonadaceae bacterium]
MDRDRAPNHGRKDPTYSPKQRLMPSVAEFAGIGLQFGLTIVVFVFGGVWLDGHLHSAPWFTIGCTFAGAGGGFYSMYRRVMAQQRAGERDKR